MKRDLKKWLKSDVVKEYINDGEDFPEDYTEVEICENLLMKNNWNGTDEQSADKLVQFIWCEAQKQFLKNILDDIDEGIEKIFGGKNQVKNDKARIVAEEAALKAWLYNKYKYLQRKNGN